MDRRLLSGMGVAVCAAAIFAGCGGGGGGGSTLALPGALPTSSSSPAVAAKPGSASFTFLLPFQRTQSTKRNAQYISPSTQSVTVSVATVNGVAPTTPVTATINIGATQPGCTQTGSQVACSLSLNAPAGNDSFAVTAFAATGGTGTIVGTATVPAVVYANAANNLTLSLSGVIAKLYLFSPAQGSTYYAYLSAGGLYGYPTSALLIPIALDSAGNQIVLPGTFNTPIVMTISSYYSNTIPGGVLLSVNGGTAAASVQVTSPSDQVFMIAQPVAGNAYYTVVASFGAPSPSPSASASPSPSPSGSSPSPVPSGSTSFFVEFYGLATPTPSPSPTPAPTLTPNPITFSYFAVATTPTPIPTATPSPSPTPYALASGATPTPSPTPSPTPTPSPAPSATPTPTSLPYNATLNMFAGSSTQYVFVNDTLNPTGLSYATSSGCATPGPSSIIASITLSAGLPSSFASGTSLAIQPTTNAAYYGTCTLTITDSTTATNSITLNVFSVTGTVQ